MDTNKTTRSRAGHPGSENSKGSESHHRWGPDRNTRRSSTARSAMEHGAGCPDLGRNGVHLSRPAGTVWPDGRMDRQEAARKLMELLDAAGPEQDACPLSAVATEWKQRKVNRGRLKAKTVDRYTRALALITAEYGALDVRTTDWETLGNERAALDGPASRRVLIVLRALLIYATKQGKRSGAHGLEEVLRRCKYQDREFCFDESQTVRLLVALDELDRTHPLQSSSREAIRAITYTGCRSSEICGLRVEDLREGSIWLRDSKTGPRRVPVSSEAMAILRRQNARDGWLFPGRIRGPITTRAVLRAFHEARLHAGLPEGVVHSMRHTFTSTAGRCGAPAPAIQSVLGHSTAEQTAKYMHASRRDEQLVCAVVANAIANAKGGAR